MTHGKALNLLRVVEQGSGAGAPGSHPDGPDGERACEGVDLLVDRVGLEGVARISESIHVVAVQEKGMALREAYDRGEDVPLTSVVLAMQRSSLAFESTLQIRNKVLKAYEDILNMPI